MQTLIGRVTATLILIGLAGPAWSIAIVGGSLDGTDVGGLDSFLGAGRAGSIADELAFINLVAGTSYSTVEKVCGESGLPSCATYLMATDHNSTTFAFQTDSNDAHFLVKTGNGSSLTGSYAGFECSSGGGTACTSFVFANNASTLFGVFDIVNQLGFTGGDINVTKVSHLTTPVGGGTTTVPEPGTLTLLGLGLLGLGLTRRRRV